MFRSFPDADTGRAPLRTAWLVLKRKSSPLPLDFEMRCCRTIAGSFPSALTALLASTQLTLLAPERFLAACDNSAGWRRFVRWNRPGRTFNPTSSPILGWAQGWPASWLCHPFDAGSQTPDQRVPMSISAQPTRWQPSWGVPSRGRCNLIFSSSHDLASWTAQVLASLSCKRKSFRCWRNGIECHAVSGVLKRGKPHGTPCLFEGEIASDCALSNRSASICTVVAGTDPRPTKRIVKSYLKRNLLVWA